MNITEVRERVAALLDGTFCGGFSHNRSICLQKIKKNFKPHATMGDLSASYFRALNSIGEYGNISDSNGSYYIALRVVKKQDITTSPFYLLFHSSNNNLNFFQIKIIHLSDEPIENAIPEEVLKESDSTTEKERKNATWTAAFLFGCSHKMYDLAIALDNKPSRFARLALNAEAAASENQTPEESKSNR